MKHTLREGTRACELHQTVGSDDLEERMCRHCDMFQFGMLRYGDAVIQGETALNCGGRQAERVPKRIEWIAGFWRKQLNKGQF